MTTWILLPFAIRQAFGRKTNGLSRTDVQEMGDGRDCGMLR